MTSTTDIQTVKKQWLDDKQAAEYLCIGRQKLSQLRDECKITFRRVKNGRMLLYNVADLDRYIERNFDVIPSTDDMRDKIRNISFSKSRN